MASAEPWWRVVGQIHDEVLRTLSLDGTVLRCIESQAPFDPDSYTCILVIEPRQLSWARPPGTDWFGPEDLDASVELDERHAELIHRYFEEDNSEASPPWTRVGWLGRSVSWLEDEFERLELRPSSRMRPITSGSRSATLRIPLDQGAAYLKVCAEPIVHEPELTAYLVRECPSLLPRVLAMESKRGLLLTEDAGEHRPVDLQSAQWLLRGLAEIQIQMAEHPDRLIELGCPDQRPEILRADLDRFVHALCQVEDDTRFFVELDAVGLRKHLDSFEEAFAELAEGEVPASLHHPNFGPESIVQRDGRARVLGWAGALGHPFVTALPLIDAFEAEGEQHQLRGLYLQHWLDFASLDRLEQLFAFAASVAPLQSVIETLRCVSFVKTRGERKHLLARLREEVEQLCASAPEDLCQSSELESPA